MIDAAIWSVGGSGAALATLVRAPQPQTREMAWKPWYVCKLWAYLRQGRAGFEKHLYLYTGGGTRSSSGAAHSSTRNDVWQT